MADYACANPPYDFRSLLVRIIGATGTFPPVRGSVTGDGILARSGTVPAKAMRCNARMAFVLWASLPEELAASCKLDPPASLQADAMGTILANVPPDTGAVKKAVKKVGTSRKRVERRFGR